MAPGAEAAWPAFLEITAFAAAAAAALLALLFFLRGIDRRAVLKDVRLQFKDAKILAISSRARFLGFNRPWDEQWKGPGVLLLSRGMLYFRPIRRSLDLSIPLGRIEAAGQDFWELSRRKRRSDCFRLAYRGADGELREAAWKVGRPSRWIRIMGEAREKIADGERNEAKRLPENEDPSGSEGALGG